MRSPDRKRRAAILAVVAVALALTSCSTAGRSSGTSAQTFSSPASASAAAAVRPVSATSQTVKQRAEKAAAGILASVPMPPGGHRLAAPLSLPGRPPQSPSIYVVAAWEVHLTAYWEAPGSPRAVLAWEVAHLPRDYGADCGSPGPPPWSCGFDIPGPGVPLGVTSQSVLIGQILDVEVASAGRGRTGIRLDAWVAWVKPRPASSLIPPPARTVTIANIGGGRPLAPVTISDPATVRKLAARIDGLGLSTTAVGTPCPAPVGPYLSLTFRARPGGPVLALVQTGQGCYTIGLTVRGEQQPALANEPTLDGQILKLAALPRKPS
jgi:hypothetical protein